MPLGGWDRRSRRQNGGGPRWTLPPVTAVDHQVHLSGSKGDPREPDNMAARAGGSRYKLCVTIDLFSRLMVGWTLQEK